jgi:hypothetical protein
MSSVLTFNYNSTMTNMVNLSGHVGSGIGLLDANLILGFPGNITSKTITSLTRTSTTATLTCPSHGMVAGNLINIQGVTNDVTWNGTWTVATTPTADTLTFTVAAQTSPATTLSTMTFIKIISSLTRSSTTATLTCQGHGIASGATIFISGVQNDPTWNGSWVVTGVTADTLTFTVSSQTTPATSAFGMFIKDISVSSLTRSGTTCSLTSTVPHGHAIGDIIGIYGADSTWNDSYVVATVPDSTHLTFETTGTPTSPASGTISIKCPPLGAKVSGSNLIPSWSKVFSGTNQAIYRSLDVESTQWFLRVDDSTTSYMTVSMLEGYSTFTTGLINQANVYWLKSDSATSPAFRPWMTVGDSKRFYLGMSWSNGSVTWQTVTTYFNLTNVMETYFFGDIIPVKGGDSYHCMIQGGTGTSTAAGQFGYWFVNAFYVVDKSVSYGSYILRSYTQLGVQTSFIKWSLSLVNTMGYTSVPITFPNPGDNGIYVESVWVCQPSSNIRGKVPGLYAPLNGTQWWLASLDKSFIKDGKTLMYVRTNNSTNNYIGGFFIDVTPFVAWSL